MTDQHPSIERGTKWQAIAGGENVTVVFADEISVLYEFEGCRMTLNTDDFIEAFKPVPPRYARFMNLYPDGETGPAYICLMGAESMRSKRGVSFKIEWSADMTDATIKKVEQAQ